MGRRTYRARTGRKGTYRQPIRGGSIETVEALLRDTPIKDIKIINPTSKFVVATYWWGEKNMNANLQNPCPEDIMALVKIEIIARHGKKYGFPAELVQTQRALKANRKTRSLTTDEVALMMSLQKVWDEWVASVMTNPDLKDEIKTLATEITQRETARTNKPSRLFPEMIREWEGYCEKAKVNYIALHTEFPRQDYQNAINGKPLFIKKVLDAVKGRGPNGSDLGVLYIDGDMWMLKYPDLFDIENVDFMARGWNTDPRSKEAALKKPAYDPYIFETSGGTMYFGNTQAARTLLDAWATESATPEQKGKADDRILSQVFTKDAMILGTNLINLPIEYLWLTDNYKSYLNSPEKPASLEDAYIEHPYCLTGEERAASQSGQSATSSREPVGYNEEITEMINYKREPELLYEYIFFDGDRKKRDGFARYLKYMKTAKNNWTQNPMMTIVDFDAKYGDFTQIAEANLAGISTPAFAQPTSGVPGSVRRQRTAPVSAPPAQLPSTATIPEILKALASGKNVYLGGMVESGPEDEVVCTDASTQADGINEYMRKLRIDTTKPMFLSAKSKVLFHLLAMCKTLADINTHINGSYMFMSRIRWNLLKGNVIPAIKTGIDFKRIVNQIWFGGDIPDWRQKIFNDNKDACERNGFVYKLWKNEDRTAENFPQTFEYQNTAIQTGKDISQSRWAQVADLARLEIVYNTSGIYVDSIIEISPALLLGVVTAINAGATFVGCNEDPCEPKMDCKNAKGQMYLTNGFFAATRASPIFRELLSPESLDGIDFSSTEINHTTGPYFLRAGIEKVKSEITPFLFESAQIYPYNKQESPYKSPTPDPFLVSKRIPGAFKFTDKPPAFYIPGGIYLLQEEFLEEKGVPETTPDFEKMVKIVELKGPLAIYHSGLGGTWSL